MDLRKIKTLIELVSESGVSELEISENDEKISIKNEKKVVTAEMVQTVSTPVAPVSAAAPQEAPVASSVSNGKPVIEGEVISSPMVGTFYASPSPGADPFVKEGDSVKEGQVIGIIEAMKLFNEINAKKSGTIKQVFIENGSPVEFGQPLFEIV